MLQRYFKALESMQAELAVKMQHFIHRMGETPV
jgi:hypothetical protein